METAVCESSPAQAESLFNFEEDLSRMVGEGEWTPPSSHALRELTRQFSTGVGFEPKLVGKAEDTPEAPTSEISDSGVYVEGLKHWNAATNCPVVSEEEENLSRPGSRYFAVDAQTGGLYNALDPETPVSEEEQRRIRETHFALNGASVSETVVDRIIKRRTAKKLIKTHVLYVDVCGKEQSQQQEAFPPVRLTHLPNRYIPTSERTNCMAMPVTHTLEGSKHLSSPCCGFTFC